MGFRSVRNSGSSTGSCSVTATGLMMGLKTDDGWDLLKAPHLGFLLGKN